MSGEGNEQLSKPGVFTPLMQRDQSARLAWSPLLKGFKLQEFVVDGDHIHGRLIVEARQALEVETSPAELTCSYLSSLKHLGQLPPSFAQLINLLADECCMESDSQTVFDFARSPDSALGFLLSGITTVVATNHSVAAALPNVGAHFHVTCSLQHMRSDPGDTDIYDAAFLDMLSALWEKECLMRRRAKWSPMPWSYIARRNEDILVVTTTVQDAATKLEVPPEFAAGVLHPEIMRINRCMYGNPIDIPWMGAKHDGFPHSPNINQYVKLRRGKKPPTTRDDAALWLAAMTFGVLEALFEAKIPEAQLLTTNKETGEQALSGAEISLLAMKWQVSWWTKINDRAYMSRGRKVAQLLNLALLAVDEEGRKDWSLGERAGMDIKILQDNLCAISLTIITLCGYAISIWGDAGLPEIHDLGRQLLDSSRYFYLWTNLSCADRLIEAGWCPNTVTQQFLVPLSRPSISNFLRLKPYIRRSADEHRDCTNNICTLYTVTDTSGYKASHVDPSCTCASSGAIKPPPGEIQHILSEDAVPVVVFDGQHLAVRRSSDAPYVAISHVWAEGLGSTTEEGLPTCQVARIAALVRTLLPTGDGAFWLDSLCVPAEKRHRKHAIQLMAATYRDADTVLVLDASLRAMCSRAGPWEENLFRIACSAWMRRVWTLQEGLLARQLAFEFADGVVDIAKELQGASRPFSWLDYYQPFLPFLAVRAASQDAASGTASVLRREYTFKEVLALLKLRTTSHIADETIAISALLPQVDVEQLLKIDGPDSAKLRLALFFRQVRTLPRELPLLQFPKLDLPCFRWAPRSLSEGMVTPNDASVGTATCDEDGLHGAYMMSRFEKPLIIPPETMQPGGTEMSFDYNVVHEASAATYKLVFHTRCHEDPPEQRQTTVDAILFVHKNLPEDAKYVQFVAVIRRPRGLAGEGRGHSVPLQCDFVAPGRLHRLTYSPSRALAAGRPPISELEYTHVVLR